MASLPPLKIAQFPDLMHSALISIVTFGLLSYITPITPRGTLFLYTLRPFCKSFLSNIFPIGSGRLMIFEMPSIMSSIDFCDRRNLSNVLEFLLFFSLFSE